MGLTALYRKQRKWREYKNRRVGVKYKKREARKQKQEKTDEMRGDEKMVSHASTCRDKSAVLRTITSEQ